MPTPDVRSKAKSAARHQVPRLDPFLLLDLQRRLHCLEGHIRGIQRMLDKQAACEDVLIQTNAVRAALNQINIKLLEGELEAYAVQCSRGGDGSATLDRLRGTLKQLMKNI